MKKLKRHGDVNFHPITEEEYKKFKGEIQKHDKEYIVARGEATGSTHKLCVDNPINLEVKEDGEVRFVKLLKSALITHTHDHETITIDPGFYVQIPEREIDHFAGIERKVID